MVISQPPGNNPSHYYRASHQRCLNCLKCFQRHLMFYTCNYNIRVTHRNGAIKIFYTNQIHGGIISRLFLVYFICPCACSSSMVKNITSNLSVWRFEHVTLHTSVGCISLQNASRTALVTQPILLSETFLIFDINYQQNTRRSDQIETIKTIMQTTRPRITWRFYHRPGCHF